MADFDDIRHLRELEKAIGEFSSQLCDLIDDEAKLKIVLTDSLKGFNINSRASLENKFLEMKKETEDKEITIMVNNWITLQNQIKKKDRQIKTLEGRRDSKKLEIKVKPN